MNPVEPTNPPQVPVEPDIFGTGVVLAMIWQVGSIALSMPLYFTCWGLIQWLALVTLYISRRRDGYPLMAKGVLIAGFVGVLLNAGCDALVLPGARGDMTWPW